MRINAYAEELTQEVEVVQKVAENGITFYGLRLFLKSPDDLHHTDLDDDRSAITLWVPWTNDRGHDFNYVYEMLRQMQTKLLQTQAAYKTPTEA